MTPAVREAAIKALAPMLVGSVVDLHLARDVPNALTRGAERTVVRVEVTEVDEDIIIGNGIMPDGSYEHDGEQDGDPAAIRGRAYECQEVEWVVPV